MKNNKFMSQWDNFTIPTNNVIFSRELFINSIDKFWTEVMEKSVSSNQHIWFLFRIEWLNNQIATIGNLQKLNHNDKAYIIDFLMDEMKNRSDYYYEDNIISITISYGIRDGIIKDKEIFINNTNNNIKYQI